MEGLAVSVEGPALDCLGLKALLQGVPQVRLVETTAEVVLLAGYGWEERIANLRLAGHTGAPGLILLVRQGPQEMRRARSEGIRVFLSPESDIPQVDQALRAAAEGRAFCCPVLLDALLNPPAAAESTPPVQLSSRLAGLSTQELRVALRAARGLSYRAIGKGLCIQEATVKTHLQRVYAKVGIARKSELRAWLPQLMELERERQEASTPDPDRIARNGASRPVGSGFELGG